ncbi:MAG: purine-binding chemotaxis protein CheW [Bacteroidia bacterium]|nr:purine-binding chemotaxis protein CheW [Bacteroidia bacterium]
MTEPTPPSSLGLSNNKPVSQNPAANHDRTTHSGKKIQVVIFQLNGQRYALPIEQIREVVITPTIAELPLSPPYVVGVANVRGDILAIIDLAKKFRLREESARLSSADKSFTIVLANPESHIGILTPEIPSTLSIQEAQLELSPNLLRGQGTEKEYIRGIIKLPDAIIVLLDLIDLVSAQDFDLHSNP